MKKTPHPKGKPLAVSNWPVPKWSNPKVLDEEFAAYEAERLKRKSEARKS